MDLRLVPLPTGLDTRLSLHFRGQWVQEPRSRTAHRFHRAAGGSWIHHVFDLWHAPQGTVLSDPTHNLNEALTTPAKALGAWETFRVRIS